MRVPAQIRRQVDPAALRHADHVVFDSPILGVLPSPNPSLAVLQLIAPDDEIANIPEANRRRSFDLTLAPHGDGIALNGHILNDRPSPDFDRGIEAAPAGNLVSLYFAISP